MKIRRAQPRDARRVADLSVQLGYECTPEGARQRLEAIGRLEEHAVLVAERGDAVVGWIHVAGRRTVESEPFAELGGLVVDGSCRGEGIGSRLVEAAADWSREQGYAALRVRSNVLREDAHRFYQRQGFRLTKRQAVFVRPLGAGGVGS